MLSGKGRPGKSAAINHSVHNCLAHQPIHRIWLATGTTLDIQTHPLLADVLQQHPIDTVNGLPGIG